jgi:hypothetical protein
VGVLCVGSVEASAQLETAAVVQRRGGRELHGSYAKLEGCVSVD